jgi:plasmid stability protein
MSQTLTVQLPSELYVRIKERADYANRSVEEEAVEMLAATASVSRVEKVREKFQRLANSWHTAVAHLSSSSKRESHPAYQEIIAMGPAVIPCLLEDLEAKRRHWFTALTAITGADPVTESDTGNISKMIDAWLLWGRTKGYQKCRSWMKRFQSKS